MMKKLTTGICLLIGTMFGSASYKAQDSTVVSGIYVSAEDFKNGKLIEEAECKKDHEEFRKHDFFQKQSFDVVYKGEKKTFLKSDIFAYRDCNNKLWRLFNNREYEIIERRDIYIYKLSKVVLNGLTVEKDPVYFFSRGLTGDVIELTFDNIKKIYSDNKEFCGMLDSEFESDKSDKALHRYDFKNKMYVVNSILIQCTGK